MLRGYCSYICTILYNSGTCLCFASVRLAQLVEQRTGVPRIMGLSPTLGTNTNTPMSLPYLFSNNFWQYNIEVKVNVQIDFQFPELTLVKLFAIFYSSKENQLSQKIKW